MNNKRKRGSILWPLIIISIGVALLTYNLGIVNQSFWGIVVGFWPLLLVALGLESIFRHRSIAGPFFLISIGTLILLTNLNVLSSFIWVALLRFWPIFLIALGLEVLIGRRSLILTLGGVFLSLAVLVGGLWFFGVRSTDESNGKTTVQISHQLDEIDKADVVIEPGVATLTIRGVNDSKELITGTLKKFENETIIDDLNISGQRATYLLKTDLNNFLVFPGTMMDRSWDLNLHSDVELDLTLQLGVSISELNLERLMLDALNIDVGVGMMEITLPDGNYNAKINGGIGLSTLRLPDTGDINIDVDGGIGAINIEIPEGANVRIDVDRGLSGFQIPSSFQKQGDHTYISKGFNPDVDQITININQGIGNISIREY